MLCPKPVNSSSVLFVLQKMKAPDLYCGCGGLALLDCAHKHIDIY